MNSASTMLFGIIFTRTGFVYILSSFIRSDHKRFLPSRKRWFRKNWKLGVIMVLWLGIIIFSPFFLLRGLDGNSLNFSGCSPFHLQNRDGKDLSVIEQLDVKRYSAHFRQRGSNSLLRTKPLFDFFVTVNFSILLDVIDAINRVKLSLELSFSVAVKKIGRNLLSCLQDMS